MTRKTMKKFRVRNTTRKRTYRGGYHHPQHQPGKHPQEKHPQGKHPHGKHQQGQPVKHPQGQQPIEKKAPEIPLKVIAAKINLPEPTTSVAKYNKDKQHDIANIMAPQKKDNTPPNTAKLVEIIKKLVVIDKGKFDKIKESEIEKNKKDLINALKGNVIEQKIPNFIENPIKTYKTREQLIKYLDEKKVQMLANTIQSRNYKHGFMTFGLGYMYMYSLFYNYDMKYLIDDVPGDYASRMPVGLTNRILGIKMQKYIPPNKNKKNTAITKETDKINNNLVLSELNNELSPAVYYSIYILDPMSNNDTKAKTGDKLLFVGLLKYVYNGPNTQLFYEYMVCRFLNTQTVFYPSILYTPGFYSYNRKNQLVKSHDYTLSSTRITEFNADSYQDYDPKALMILSLNKNLPNIFYLLQEHNPKMVSLRDYIDSFIEKRGTFGALGITRYLKEFIEIDLPSIICQLYAPLIALRKKFTHYNLSMDNVLIYKIPDKKFAQMTYTMSNVSINEKEHYNEGEHIYTSTLQTRIIVKMKNYGRAYFNASNDKNDFYNTTTIFNTLFGDDGMMPKMDKDFGMSFINPRETGTQTINSAQYNPSADLLAIHQLHTEYLKPYYKRTWESYKPKIIKLLDKISFSNDMQKKGHWELSTDRIVNIMGLQRVILATTTGDFSTKTNEFFKKYTKDMDIECDCKWNPENRHTPISVKKSEFKNTNLEDPNTIPTNNDIQVLNASLDADFRVSETKPDIALKRLYQTMF